MNLLLFGVISTAALTVILGFVALVKNTRARPNRELFFLSCAIAAWMVSNYFSNLVYYRHEDLLLLNQLVLATGGINMLCIVRFISTMANWPLFNRIKRYVWVYALLASFITFTPLVAKDVMPKTPVTEIVFGPLAIIYFIWLVGGILATIPILIWGLRHNSGLNRARLQIIGLSIIITFSVIVFTNGLLPFLSGSYEASAVAPLFVIFMVAGFVYSIVRQRLFDIRLAIVRAVGYAITLTLLISFYGLCIYLATNRVLRTDTDAITIDIVLVLPAIVAAVTFHHIQRFIEKLTARVFYQSSYDLRKALDALSDNLLNSNNVEGLVSSSVNLIKQTVHPKETYVTIFDDSDVYFDYHTRKQDHLELHSVATSLRKHQIDVALIDEVEDEHQRALLEQLDIHAVFRMGAKDKPNGFLLLGPKDNGSIYTSQDIAYLHICAKNLSIAVENAKNYEKVSHFAESLKDEVYRATSRLRTANKHLRELSQTKDEFMSMAAHQLRPQLTATQGFVELMLRGGGGKPSKEQTEILRFSRSSVRRMIRLVNDMLNAVRFSSGQFKLDLTEIDLSQLVVSEVAGLRLTAKDRNIQIDVQKPSKKQLLRGDEIKLREVILNLIDNAVHYSPDDSRISVVISYSQKQATLTVKDHGIGVPKDSQKKLFTKFYRAANAQAARPAGTGVGLFVAKKVVEAHNGKMIFESEYGQGSTFGFVLPL